MYIDAAQDSEPGGLSGPNHILVGTARQLGGSLITSRTTFSMDAKTTRLPACCSGFPSHDVVCARVISLRRVPCGLFITTGAGEPASHNHQTAVAMALSCEVREVTSDTARNSPRTDYPRIIYLTFL